MAEFADKEPAEILVDQSAELLSESVVVPMDVPTETEQSIEAKVNTEVNVVVVAQPQPSAPPAPSALYSGELLKKPAARKSMVPTTVVVGSTAPGGMAPGKPAARKSMVVVGSTALGGMAPGKPAARKSMVPTTVVVGTTAPGMAPGKQRRPSRKSKVRRLSSRELIAQSSKMVVPTTTGNPMQKINNQQAFPQQAQPVQPTVVVMGTVPERRKSRRLSSRQLIAAQSTAVSVPYQGEVKISQPAVILAVGAAPLNNSNTNNMMQNVMLDDPEPTLYQGSWPKRGICCFQGAVASNTYEDGPVVVIGNGIEMSNMGGGTGHSTSTIATSANDKRAFKIAITDTHITYTTRTQLLPCPGCCPQLNTKTSDIDSLNTIIVREDNGGGCCGML